MDKPTNRPVAATPRNFAASRRMVTTRSTADPKWMLWGALSIVIAIGVAVFFWRLGVEKDRAETDARVEGFLKEADKLMAESRDDDAETQARKAMELLPADVRVKAMMERIATKRELISKDKAATSNTMMAIAANMEKESLEEAVKFYGEIANEKTNTPELRKAAEDRAKAIRDGVCSLILPDDWPPDGVVSINSSIRNSAKKKVEGIGYGKQLIVISRPGYRDPVPLELEFKTTEPIALPSFAWKLKGATVFVSSVPSGAEVWFKGKSTGRKTPCEIEDVDEGPVDIVLKHPRYPETTVSGNVEGRLPLKLTGKLRSN